MKISNNFVIAVVIKVIPFNLWLTQLVFLVINVIDDFITDLILFAFQFFILYECNAHDMDLTGQQNFILISSCLQQFNLK